MADPRTFVLIGDFQDNITPALESINNSIAGLKRTMSTMTSKRGGGFSDVTQSVGKLISSQKHLANSIKEVGDAAKVATGELKSYKNMVGKVASAHYHIAKAANQAGDKIASSNNKAIASIDRLDRREKLYASARRQRMRNLSSVGAASYSPTRRTTPRPAAAPRMAGGGGGGGYRDTHGEFGLSSAFAFGQQLGFGIAEPVTSAVLSGFQMGVGLLAKTMQHIQTSFAERVEDQMTDLQTAGGYYAIAKRQKDPMFTSLQSAIRFTQETNLVMSRLASDLPGSTEDYVKVSKRIGDSVMRLVDQNEKGSIAYAQQLISKGGLQEQYKNISLEGPGAREGAISVILGELTKKTVLAGFGGSTGRGGATGAYGLPAQMEKLITNPDTSLAQLQKYAAVFGDPKIMAALERAMPELEKAGTNMLERAKVVNNMLDEIVPPEMIAAMRKSMAGIMEAYRSAFLDPEMGLFGFGRKIEGLMQPMVNEFGQFVKEEIDANGKKMYRVVKTAGEASQVTLGVFEMFADIISNYGAIIKPIVDNLYLLWDPIEGLATVLQDARIISTQLLDLFRKYDEALRQEVGKLEAEGKEGLAKQLGMTRSLRSSLLTIFDIFTDLGAFSEEDFKKYRAMIIDPTKGVKDLTNLVKTAVTTFFDSDAGRNAGKFVGEMLREIVVSISEFTGFISKLGTTQLAEGFMEGFGQEGVSALQKIFTDIYTLLFEAAKAILPKIPWQVYAIAAAGVAIPAAVAALGVAISGGILKIMQFMKDIVLRRLAGCAPRSFAQRISGMCGEMGAAAAGDGSGKPRGNRPGRKGKGFERFFIGSRGAKAASSLRERGRSSAQTAYKAPIGPLPPHSFYKGQRTQHMHPGFTVAGRAQQAAQIPGRLAKRVGAAPISPVMQAMGFGGGKGGRSLIRQRNMMGGAARGMAKMGRFVPGGALAFGALDAGMRMAQGEDAGKAIGGAAASTIGATLGGILGQTLIPIPGVGAALGTVAGGFIGDKIFNAVVPSAEEQKRAADLQLEAARMQQIVARSNSGVDVAAAGGNQFNFGDPAQFSRYISMLGLQQDAQVKQFQGLYTLDQQKQNAAAELGKKYNEEVARLRKVGLSQDQIAKELAPLGKTFNKARGEAQTSLTNLNKQWEKIGTESRTKILSGADNIAKSLDDAALKIKAAGDMAAGNAGRNRRSNVGNRQGSNWNDMSLSDWPAGVPLPGTPSESNQEGLNLSRYTRSSRKNWGEGCSISGSLGNGSVSSVDSFNSIARSSGLSVTSGYRPGSKGWHGVDRARDYSNGYAPTPQMMEFAQTLASQYGGKLKELIYTPLGYSIKDGRKVAPIAAGSHYNHVHVAYANGIGNPIVAPTEKLAQKIDAQALGKANVKTYTAGKGEFGGSNTFGDINVTVNAAGMSNPREIAYAVAIELGNAVQSKMEANLGYFA